MPLLRRLATYQRERFPLAAYVPLIAIAAFSALAYARAARGVGGLPSLAQYLTCATTLLGAFFVLRVADEHKDAETDRLHRSHLPVPRGVVTLAELRAVGATIVVAIVAMNAALDPWLLVPLSLAAVWIALMTREFFVRDWLRARPLAYLLSHMIVMPVLFLYAGAVDWIVADEAPAVGLLMFLAATFASGLVLEIGRKVRAPSDERDGVETYSGTWGERRAVLVWVGVVVVAATLVGFAGSFAGSRWAPLAAPVAGVPIVAAAIPALRNSAGRTGRTIETAAGVWNLLAYALLSLPWLERAL